MEVNHPVAAAFAFTVPREPEFSDTAPDFSAIFGVTRNMVDQCHSLPFVHDFIGTTPELGGFHNGND